ncbi:MAG: hypothetical protein HLUCCA05_06485 [Roseibaca calidilacus]|uniref:DNA gyrase inhibitor YacG n=1 Tax=Roseibaca calidilacus TaxID=1666912 RepID=A0A0N8K6T1_9RHOB|nr:DNA gyrase inhibitor YacG [Roseibaca calidilacus]KPP89801.1 MAG: hypothetical protein HLUCCA05_06485 [Roseibaca calidilacus]CUX80780.1 hypothetical protein Ga0058931_1337 [Roseibaca calidilacus]
MSCPICRKAALAEYRPFCSRRCADIDLARWLRADYAIPVPLTDAEDDVVTDPPNLPESH